MPRRVNPNWPLEQRFAGQLQRVSSGCLEWQGKRDRRGYGKICAWGKESLAHRVAWQIHRGPIPEGMCVCHRCDNQPCCDIEHLFLGTHQDNMRDAVEKGLLTGNPTPLRGERNPRAKLSDERARELMREVAALPRVRGGRPAGALSQRQLALKYGISPSLISCMLVGKCRVECP